MCIQIIERYAVCKHVYHRHAVDPCRNAGAHAPTEKTVLVGYACPSCTSRRAAYCSSAGAASSSSCDSGYQSSGKSGKSARAPKGWSN